METRSERSAQAESLRGTATIPEFAVRYGIAKSTAYALAQRDALPIPVIRLGRRLVVSRARMEQVLQGIDSSCRPSSTWAQEGDSVLGRDFTTDVTP